ncbi:hypothetical protein [Dethiothermospora halolimnae]|uniref:hypothetical protein n=1 Tax=Dethiothermospora halolimnae TaxID=3114390 RepID=UPI003CCC32D3
MKKKLLLTLSVFLILNLIGCSKDNENTLNKKVKENKREIAIAMRDKRINSVLSLYKQTFEFDNDIKVKFDKIKAPTYEEYLKKLNIKLYLEDGPTLILIGRWRNTYKKYVDQGVALEVADNIPNIEKLYDGFKNDKMYYVPIGMDYTPITLNKKHLDDLRVKESKLNWTKEDYINIKNKWLELQPRIFSYREYLDIVKYPLNNLRIFNKSMEKVKINTNEIKAYIHNAKKQIYSGNYDLKREHKYEKYSKYYEYKRDEEVQNLREFNKAVMICDIDDRLLSLKGSESGLKFREMYFENPKGIVLLPDVMRNDYQIDTWGFIVNRNGKNTDLGYKFINGLLEEEQQINIYREIGEDFPVIKGIEEEIKEIEKERKIEDRFIKLKEYILDKFNKGEYKVYNSQDSKKVEFYEMLEEDLVKIIFDEKEYFDEELSRKLQKLEDKYNMWLTE